MSRTPSPYSGRSSLQLPTPDAADGGGSGSYWASRKGQHDPRTSSTQSLLPSLKDGRRTLLVVYLHGFMGNNSSFRSFPAHVHGFLRDALAETHVIHSKIYPRYKTYKAIDVARDNFSKWLEPHESPTTDVVLIGHSMGGLLAADVVLMPRNQGGVSGFPFRHRILGTVSLDAPLLGLHPGIVVSGIASLFRPAATPGAPPPQDDISPDPHIYSEISLPSGAASPSLSVSPLPSSSQGASQDPTFNPPFFNDVAFVDRGWLKNVAHFAKKHKEENIFEAAATHIVSHLEFGGCLADYPGLRIRYNNLRKLEDVDDSKPSGGLPRVRFVNYYTASTGLPKKPKTPPSDAHLQPPENHHDRDARETNSGISTPRISIEDHSETERPMILQELEPEPEPEPDSQFTTTDTNTSSLTNESNSSAPTPATDITTPEEAPDSSSLPTIPDPPVPPEPLNLHLYTDKETRKQAEKEAKRALKAYNQAIKDREHVIKTRQKLIEKQQRQVVKDAEKRAKASQKELQAREKAEQKQLAKAEADFRREMETLRLEDERKGRAQDMKQKKEKKFCMLPSKSGGVRDPAWVRVYMEGYDEVGAHCGLFVPGPHYEKLVGDVGMTIVEWVHEDASRRAMAEM